MPQAAAINQNTVVSVSKQLFFDMIYHHLFLFMAVYVALPFWMFGASFFCSLFKFSVMAVAIVNTISFMLEFTLIWILLGATDMCSPPPRAIEETPSWPVAFGHACIFSTFLLFQLCVPTLALWSLPIIYSIYFSYRRGINGFRWGLDLPRLFLYLDNSSKM